MTYYAFLPLMVGFVGVYAFKPDTRYVLLCEEWVRGERGGGIGKEGRGDWEGMAGGAMNCDELEGEDRNILMNDY